jgi:hypothetical protein
MAFDWEHVEAIRAEQDSARNRRDLNALPTDEVSNEIYSSPSGRNAKVPGLDHWEQMIHKVRTQLIDYIIEHGLVQGFEYDGVNEPIKNGKIVITAEMLQRVTDRFGYFKEKETLEFIEKYLPEHHYVADENYVHTDNNYTDAEKVKLRGIADGAEMNKVISVLFNGVETIDPETRVATITITPADVKAWYEQNPDTNVFTDAEKAKLESLNLDELSNKVEDVTLDGETVVKDKVAVLTAKKIKNSYESNADTNVFTDADKVLVEHVLPEVQKSVNQHEQRIDALEKSQTTQDAEIKDAKDSISELGDEVNSVAGRVTTLETSQKAQDGRFDALEAWKGATDTTLTELGKKNATQDEEISKLKEKNTSQDGEISNIKTKDTEQDGRLDALEISEETQDADIAQLKKDVKNAGKVDDVTVGGISVVEDKVAKIPAIPSADEFVPYEGATKDVNIGDHKLSINTTGSISNVPASAEMHIGKFERGKSDVIPGIKINAKAETTISGNAGSLLTDLMLFPSVFAVTATANTGGTIKETSFQTDQTGVTISGESGERSIKISPGKITGLYPPTEGRDAASKQYVDESIAAIPQVDPSGYVPYFGADKTLQMGANKITFTNTATAARISSTEFGLSDVTGGGLYLYPGQIVTGKDDKYLRIRRATGDGNVPQEIEIADPTSDTHAATKKYVDNKFGSIGQEISITTEQFNLPDMPAGNSVVLSRNVAYTGKEVLGIVPYSEDPNLLVVPTFRNTTGGFNKLTIQVTNISTKVAIGSGFKCGVNVTLRTKTE